MLFNDLLCVVQLSFGQQIWRTYLLPSMRAGPTCCSFARTGSSASLATLLAPCCVCGSSMRCCFPDLACFSSWMRVQGAVNQADRPLCLQRAYKRLEMLCPRCPSELFKRILGFAWSALHQHHKRQESTVCQVLPGVTRWPCRVLASAHGEG